MSTLYLDYADGVEVKRLRLVRNDSLMIIKDDSTIRERSLKRKLGAVFIQGQFFDRHQPYMKSR